MSPKKNSKKTSLPKTPKTNPPSHPTPWVPKASLHSAWALFGILVLAAGIYQTFFWSSRHESEIENKDISITEVIAGYQSGSYDELVIDGGTLYAKKRATEKFLGAPTRLQRYFGTYQATGSVREVDVTTLPRYDTLSELGLSDPKNPTKVSVKDLTNANIWKEVVGYVLGTLFFVAVVVFFFSRMGGGMGGSGPMSFIRSKARLYDPENEKEKITFDSVAGSEEEKEDLNELVDFLKSPEKYDKLGAKIPRGVLMQGPPGTGKTLLARAVAGEAGVPFFSISGSEFVEMFVGVGASRVRALFTEAKEKAPAIIFIDEIDAIGKKRGPGIGGGHDEREQTLNQILTEMDGFDNDTHIIVLAATNRADVLDRALLRPGRFDRKVTINLPNLVDREKILIVHTKNKPLAEDVDLKKIASATVGFSGADLANLMNESAILAGKRGEEKVTHAMIQASIEKVVIGNTRKTSRLTAYEKRLTAFHEVGHAVLHHVLPHLDPVYKVSIVPRGPTGGVTWSLPEKDRTYVSKIKFYQEIIGLYGGRVAEELHFGAENVTTGASNDIERATEIARGMVTRYGFDDTLGAENFSSESIEGNFLWAEGRGKVVSEKTQERIDTAVKDILSRAYSEAKDILTSHKALHITIAEKLLEKEELLADEFKALFVDVPWIPEKYAL